MKPVFIEPDSHPAASQSPLGVDVEPLNADIAMTIDDPRELQMAEDTPQVVWINRPAKAASQDRDRSVPPIRPVTMSPMTGRIEQLDEGCMFVLDLGQGRGLLEFCIRQTSLDIELGFDEILPGLP